MLRSTLITSFGLTDLFKIPVHLQTQLHWGLGLQHMNLGEMYSHSVALVDSEFVLVSLAWEILLISLLLL